MVCDKTGVRSGKENRFLLYHFSLKRLSIVLLVYALTHIYTGYERRENEARREQILYLHQKQATGNLIHCAYSDNL